MTFVNGQYLTGTEMSEAFGDTGWVTPSPINWSSPWVPAAGYPSKGIRQVGTVVQLSIYAWGGTSGTEVFTLDPMWGPSWDVWLPAIGDGCVTNAMLIVPGGGSTGGLSCVAWVQLIGGTNSGVVCIEGSWVL